jgi:hypothetical protein
MNKLLMTIAATFFACGIAGAQDFRIVEYTKGYYNPRTPEKQIKINVMKKAMPLATYDFDKDGTMDSLNYKMSLKGGQIATIMTFDAKEDDWVTLYKSDLKNFGGEDGVWFYQLDNKAGGGPPMYVVYTSRKDGKFVTVIQYDTVAKKFKTKDYPVFTKNLFPHKFVANKKKILNQNGNNEETFEEIPVE